MLGSLSLASVGNVAGVARERGWCRQQVWDCALLGVDAGDGRTSDRSGSRVGLGLARYCPRRCRSWGLWWVCDGRVLFLLIVAGAWSQCWACAVGLALRVPPGCCYACREAGCASVRGRCASVGPQCLVSGRSFLLQAGFSHTLALKFLSPFRQKRRAGSAAPVTTYKRQQSGSAARRSTWRSSGHYALPSRPGTLCSNVFGRPQYMRSGRAFSTPG